MMEWQHWETKKPAAMTSEEPIGDLSTEIKSWEDLPSPEFWEKLNMPPEITARGRKSIDSWVTAFMKKRPKVYYLTIFPSGWPDGVVPE